jgi:hypothetical protein
MTNDQKKSLRAALAALSQNYVYPADARLAKECVQNVLTAHLDAFEEVWYQIESSPEGTTDEWVNSGYGQFDTREALDKKLVELRDRERYPSHAGFQFRGIRVTHIEEVQVPIL